MSRRGRPPLPPGEARGHLTIRLPQWIIDWLNAQDKPASHVIEQALRFTHHLHRRH